MLVPSIFNTNLSNDFFNDSFDSMFRDAFRSPFERMSNVSCMSTDIQDLGDKYQMEIELPGYEKKDLKADLKDGYLTVTAERSANKEEKDENGKFVRRERYMGSCQRSFYVGKNVTQEDIHASFENGILKLMVPKKEVPAVEEKKYISIQ
ncbi:MAG: Hsp20/alpha crystallin family protein [Lachnospiraceae bacterium]|nr:Hsp20/alpha crystallin family protein [Lachnospiraceae bacterium]